MTAIPIAKPILDEREVDAVRRVILSGWVTQGPEVAAFEREFAEYVGAPHACAVSNCTTALHLALLAVGVGQGDEVITVSHSFVATANAVHYCGAQPVFIDIEASGFNMDPGLIERAVTSRTKAILCVHQLGMPCDLARIVEIGRRLGIPVVEDAACASGSEILWNGQWEKIGKPHGDIACFSFHPRKVITTGDGGMITTANAEFDQKFRLWRQHSMSVPDTVRHGARDVIFESHPEVGFNYRMTDLQAAVGRVQITRLASIVEERRRIAGEYVRQLAAVDGLVVPVEPTWARTNWQSFCVELPAQCDQREVMQRMLDGGISTRRAVMNAHLERPYQSAAHGQLARSERAQQRGVILPLAPSMTASQVRRSAKASRPPSNGVPDMPHTLRNVATSDPQPDAAEPAPSSTTAAGGHTYGQILKSSAIVGGSTMVNLAVSIVRSKSMALLLGPAGVGLVGLYSSVLDLTHSIDGLGTNSSGVRQIAESAGSGQAARVARTAAVLRRTSMFLGLIGAVLLALMSRQVSRWTFGNEKFSLQIALLSIAVWLSAVSDGQSALIQGLRRITDLARIRVLSAGFGAATTLGLVYLYGEKAIVPSLVGAAAITLLISWFYRRKIEMPAVSLTVPQIREELLPLLSLGFAFMASGVLSTGAAYAIRIIVRTSSGLEAAGLYQSAWAIGGLYVGFILQAMGSDFYPRLTAVASDNAKCNRLVNEQAEIGMLIAGPGVIATLTFAPVVIAVFYSSSFAAAVEPLRWICLGMAFRVIAFPMGYITLAKGAKGIFFWSEVAATIVHVGLAFVLVRWFGLPGATMAFFLLYIWHSLLMYAIVRRLSGFRWSSANLRTGLLFLLVIGVVFCGLHVLPLWLATSLGTLAALTSGIYSLRIVCRLVSLERAPLVVRKLLAWFRISGPVGLPPVFNPVREV